MGCFYKSVLNKNDRRRLQRQQQGLDRHQELLKSEQQLIQYVVSVPEGVVPTFEQNLLHRIFKVSFDMFRAYIAKGAKNFRDMDDPTYMAPLNITTPVDVFHFCVCSDWNWINPTGLTPPDKKLLDYGDPFETYYPGIDVKDRRDYRLGQRPFGVRTKNKNKVAEEIYGHPSHFKAVSHYTSHWGPLADEWYFFGWFPHGNKCRPKFRHLEFRPGVPVTSGSGQLHFYAKTKKGEKATPTAMVAVRKDGPNSLNYASAQVRFFGRNM